MTKILTKLVFVLYCNSESKAPIGVKWKWMLSRLPIPVIWPIKECITLSKQKILDLEIINFQLLVFYFTSMIVWWKDNYKFDLYLPIISLFELY